MHVALRPLVLGTATLGAALGAAFAQDTPEHGRDVAGAGELFRKTCAACHVPPDPAFETDRAWLHQVFDTA